MKWYSMYTRTGTVTGQYRRLPAGVTHPQTRVNPCPALFVTSLPLRLRALTGYLVDAMMIGLIFDQFGEGFVPDVRDVAMVMGRFKWIEETFKRSRLRNSRSMVVLEHDSNRAVEQPRRVLTARPSLHDRSRFSANPTKYSCMVDAGLTNRLYKLAVGRADSNSMVSVHATTLRLSSPFHRFISVGPALALALRVTSNLQKNEQLCNHSQRRRTGRGCAV
jgi:hypothetical protein